MSHKSANNREFTIEVEGHEPFDFIVTQADFGRFLRDAQRDILMGANNLLLATCADQERLMAAFSDDWGLPLQILAPIQESLMGDRVVAVKKLKRSPPN